MPASKNHLLPKGDQLFKQSRKRTRADAASESLALQHFKLQNDRITIDGRSNQLSSIQNVEDLLKNAASNTRGSRQSQSIYIDHIQNASIHNQNRQFKHSNFQSTKAGSAKKQMGASSSKNQKLSLEQLKQHMLNLGTRNNFNNQNIMSTVYGNLAANGTSSMHQRKSRNSGGGSLVQPALSQYQMMGGNNALTLVQLQSDNQTIDRAPNQLSAGVSPYFQGGKKLPTGQTFYNNNDFMQSSQNQYVKVGNIKSHIDGTKIKKSAITARKSYGGGAIG